MEGSIPVSELTKDKQFVSKTEFRKALSDILNISDRDHITGVGYDGDRFVVEVAKE